MKHSRIINQLAVVVLATVSVVGIFSCKGTSNPLAPAYVTGQYWPFAIGNQWTWSIYSTDTLGAKVAVSDQQITMTVTGTIVKNGVSAWVMKSVITGKNNDSGSSYAAYTPNGDFMAFNDTSNGAGRGKWI